MRKTFILLALISGTLSIYAQQLTFYNSRNIALGKTKLSKKEVFELMKDNPEAMDMYKSGKTLKTLGSFSLFTGIGIAGIGFLIDTYKKDDTPLNLDDNSNYTFPFLIAGGGLIIAAIPLKIIGKKKIRNSVELYNQTAESASIIEKKNPQLSLLSFTSDRDGIGFRYSF